MGVRKRFCVNGHDIEVVGRTHGNCRECQRERQRAPAYRAMKRSRYRARFDADPEYRERIRSKKERWEHTKAGRRYVMLVYSRQRAVKRRIIREENLERILAEVNEVLVG